MSSAERVKFSLLIAIVMMALASKNESLVSAANSSTWAGAKYEMECTMCSACDNPCSTPSPPPPPSPSTANWPPPPSPPTSGCYYYSPPPPRQSTNYHYPSPPPPAGVIGNYYPTTYKSYPKGPTPPLPNPVVPYFPYYYHSPPPSNSAATPQLTRCPTSSYVIAVLFIILCFI